MGITLYIKDSFTDRNGRAVMVGRDDPNYNVKPYAIFKECNGVLYQVSKWYMYRGWADRKIKQYKKEGMQ